MSEFHCTCHSRSEIMTGFYTVGLWFAHRQEPEGTNFVASKGCVDASFGDHGFLGGDRALV